MVEIEKIVSGDQVPAEQGADDHGDEDLALRNATYALRISNQDEVTNPDDWGCGIEQLKRMPIIVQHARPAPAGAPAPVIFSGVSWKLLGPQPLRIDHEQNFQGAGPASGEVVSILIDPSGAADQVIYIATNNGGVWKSIDGGATWQPKTDFMESLSMGALAMDPVDHQIIYVGTGNDFDGGGQGIRGAGIYRSVDAGETWVQLSRDRFLGKRINRIVVPAPNVLLVATDQGLFRSVDGGSNFGANAPSFNDGQPVLTGADPMITDLALDNTNSAKVYACIQGGGIFVSTDAGVTFPTNILTAGNGAPAPFGWITFAQATKTPGVLYAMVANPPPAAPTPFIFAKFKAILRSNDGGVSWNTQTTTGPAPDAIVYTFNLGVDPLDDNRIYVGFDEMFSSLDGGQNFSAAAISANQVHFDHHAILFSPHPPAAAPTPFYVGTDGGLYRNNDGNTNWDKLNETIATNLFLGIDVGRNSAANRQITFGGCQDTGTVEQRPTFAGNDWHLGVDGDGGEVKVDPNNPQVAYGRDGYFPKNSFIATANGGDDWTFVQAAASGLPAVPGGTSASATPLGIDPNSGAAAAPNTCQIVYVAHDTDLYKSTDQAKTFTKMHTFAASITAFANTKLDSKVLVIGLTDGTVFRTENADAGAGATWTQLVVNNAPAKPVSSIALDPDDDKVAVVTYPGILGLAPGVLSRHVFFTPNLVTTPFDDIGGTAAASPDDMVPDLPVHTALFDPSTTPHSILIGCDVDVLRTTDLGGTWHIFGAGLPNADCTALAADYSVTPPLIRLGTYGRGAYELTRLTGPNIFIMSNLAFGDVAQGANLDKTFDIFNIGDSDLTITNISDATANPNFSLVGAPAMPLTIAAGDKQTITLRFSPAAPGKQIVMYSVQSNSATHPVFGIPVSGSGAFSGAQVTGVIPASGPAAGGTPVIINGTGFTGATAVNFGTQAATGMTVDNDTQIHAVTPPGGGDVDVAVVTPSGTTPPNPAAHFKYVGSTISVSGLNPNQGLETGGTMVVITGAGFTGATQVLFGAFAASGFTVDSDTQIHAISPAGTGLVDVLVATPAGTSVVSAGDKFQYTAQGGAVSGGGAVGAAGGGTNGSGPGAGLTGDEDILHALADILRTGTDPDVLEAQRILLRRIALEGNIIDSRVPAPRNITEIGGYFNLLATLGLTDIRTETLASVLGVAGPANPIGLDGVGPTLTFVTLPNDRPAGAAQPTYTTGITVRSDLADAFAYMMQRIHGFGCALPFFTPPRVLPHTTPGTIIQPDFVLLLGRVLQVAPGALLGDPAHDPVAIARLSSDPPDRWQLVVQELDGQTRISSASWVAFQASDSNVAAMPPAPRQYLPIAPILADSGWYSAQPFAAPNSAISQGSLPRLMNVSGLVRGVTRLGDELLLLYPQSAVMTSALAGKLSWVWNGTTFVPPASPV